ncbi:Gfo/Idh/MocA family oxidoreductase [Streptomyces bathyalis]|uniref:Gfo/Idh/MocA family oxidoreductase n=1 Tax=Streptomyces bathyalis TaxID=2710756 RepID=A0A7T1T964_9ACTN|nr:Gfo/Idh/MocA family oxidoreductase [Streptomyces bathyalis]QPP08672.1 Gfo/Idh/MocA family oxidoreductase [Streptomyces bathyalis]
MDRTEEAAPPCLRVGLIGYGLAGSVFHAPLISATEGLTLDTVVTADPERRAQVHAELGSDMRTLATTEELFARAGELDLVVVASPNRTHVALARRALEAGLPVVVDKPLAGTAAEAQQLASLAAERGLMLSAFHNRRWDNDFLTVRSLLADGALGDRVRRFESRYERWRPELKGGWRESGDPAEVGGLLYDLGSHLVDQALTLFGPATSVYAETDARRPGAEADDDAFIALTHADGVRSHLWMSAVAAQLGPRFRVLGSEAAYVKDGLDPQEAALREGARPVSGERWGVEPESAWGTIGDLDARRPVPTRDGDYPAYYAGIAAALREGTQPPVTAHEAVATIRVLEAARTSALESCVITTDLS